MSAAEERSGIRPLFYDLHIHSCLSPCADPDMTPGNIAGMAMLKGLDIIAVTDHNSCANCAAAIAAGEKMGIAVLPGMELCTSEEIHVVCLFAELSAALAFADEVYARLPAVANRPDIFGEQQIVNENDEVLGCEPRLLINAARVGVNEAVRMAAGYGGAAFPAHVDKPSNGIYGVLGAFPAETGFCAAEISAACDRQTFVKEHAELAGKTILTNSDAHYLWQISERQNSLAFSGEDKARGLLSLLSKNHINK